MVPLNSLRILAFVSRKWISLSALWSNLLRYTSAEWNSRPSQTSGVISARCIRVAVSLQSLDIFGYIQVMLIWSSWEPGSTSYQLAREECRDFGPDPVHSITRLAECRVHAWTRPRSGSKQCRFVGGLYGEYCADRRYMGYPVWTLVSSWSDACRPPKWWPKSTRKFLVLLLCRDDYFDMRIICWRYLAWPKSPSCSYSLRRSCSSCHRRARPYCYASCWGWSTWWWWPRYQSW